jgi:hypothetical protein
MKHKSLPRSGMTAAKSAAEEIFYPRKADFLPKMEGSALSIRFI